MSIDDAPPRRLSKRELRNESGRVLRAVSEGHSFDLTNSGTLVGRIVPVDAHVTRLLDGVTHAMGLDVITPGRTDVP